MRTIHLARLDKVRPAVVMTRGPVRPARTRVTVIPITSRIRGLSSEVSVGAATGLETASVVACDEITTIDASALGRQVGYLLPSQERDLVLAMRFAFDLVKM